MNIILNSLKNIQTIIGKHKIESDFNINKADLNTSDDSFNHSNNLSEPFIAHTFVSTNLKEVDLKEKEFDNLNNKRYEKIGSFENIEPKEVSKRRFNLTQIAQKERDYYYTLQKKLYKHDYSSLNIHEKLLFNKLMKEMEPSEQPRTLYRFVMPYEGFEEQVNSGTMNLDGFTSTLAYYDKDYFGASSAYSTVITSKNATVKPAYILRIHTQEGQKMLECNGTYKGNSSALNSEVILPPCQCRVGNIDNDLHIIDVYTE